MTLTFFFVAKGWLSGRSTFSRSTFVKSLHRIPSDFPQKWDGHQGRGPCIVTRAAWSAVPTLLILAGCVAAYRESTVIATKDCGTCLSSSSFLQPLFGRLRAPHTVQF